MYCCSDSESEVMIAPSLNKNKHIKTSEESGQALVLGMVVLVVTALTIFATFNTARVVNDKTLLVNAADAAAYSAGVTVARELNFLAYTNRSMMASHLAVGHMVSYTSWARTVGAFGQAAANGLTGLSFIPGTAIADLISISGQGQVLADQVSPLYIAYNQTLIYSQSVAQRATYDSLALGGATLEAMELVASAHQLDFDLDDGISKEIRVNNIAGTGGHFWDIYLKVLANGGNIELLDQIARDITGQVDGVTELLVEFDSENVSDTLDVAQQTLNALGSSDWFNNRGWQASVDILGFNIPLLDKTGSTQQVQDGVSGNMNWTATDSYIRPIGNVVLATGGADANTLCLEANIAVAGSCADSDGMVGYTGFKQHFEIDRSGSQSVKLIAFLTQRTDERYIQLNTYDESDDASNRGYISAVARAEVYFQRPGSWDGANNVEEAANLYNPFWRTHLIQ